MKTFFIAFISTFFAPLITAQIAYVNSNATTGANTGTSWKDAFTTLQSALNQNGVSEIWIAEGTYWPVGADRSASFAIKRAVRLYGGFPAIGDPKLADRDIARYPTVLSGDIGRPSDTSDNTLHVITVDLRGPSRVLLDGLTIRDGNSSYGGGGVLADGDWDFLAKLTLHHCSLIGNYAHYEGAGLDASHLSLDLEDCTFEDNYSDYQGGALNFWSDHSSTPLLRLHVKNCTFRRNSSGYQAGAVDVQGHAMFSDCLFESNQAKNEEGALEHGGEDTLHLLNCIFRQNMSGDGGAMGENGRAYIANCLFEGNIADGAGGAITQFIPPALPGGQVLSNPLKVVNCTFVDNFGREGGGVFDAFAFDRVENSATFANCIFYQNVPEGVDLFEIGGQIQRISVTHCWSEKSPCSTKVKCLGNIQTGTTPEFSTSGDHTLAENSPCIDAGDKQHLLPIVVSDLAGQNRINGSNVDIGAYEFNTTATGAPATYQNAYVYPNPTSGVLHLSSPLEKLIMRDMYGHVVYATPQANQIDLSSLQSGCYLLNGLQNKNKIYNIKIFKY